jgi:hypothetical protein
MRSSALALHAVEYGLNGKPLLTWGTWGTFPGAFRACISSPSIPTAIYMRPRLTGADTEVRAETGRRSVEIDRGIALMRGK